MANVGIRAVRKTRLASVILISSLLAVSILLAAPAIPKSYAHAFILKSTPADGSSLSSPPSSVDVYFSDPVEVKYSQVKVIDSSGKQVDNGDVKYLNSDQTILTVGLPAGLKNGVYTVSTKVLDATDGHVTENAFVFGVGQAPPGAHGPSSAPSAQLQIPEAAARFPALVGQVLVVGIAFAALWLWRPVSKIAWLGTGFSQTKARIDARVAKLMLIGAIILIASGIGMIAVQANSIGASIPDAILTKFGNVWITRMVQSGILLAITVGVYNRSRKRGLAVDEGTRPLLPRTELAAMLVIGIAILATTTMISHAASTSQALAIGLDFIHNVVASVWIGGIIYLALIVVPAMKERARSADGNERQAIASTLSIIIPRFSIVVMALLGGILITGPLLLYTLEPSLDLTLSSLYGKALIAKLILAGGMAAVGGYNQRVIHREALGETMVSVGANGRSFEETGSTSRGRGGSSAGGLPDPKGRHPPKRIGRSPDLGKTLSKFGRSTMIESGLGIGLLIAVAVLVNTGTPQSEFQGVLQQNQNTNATAALPPQPFVQTQFVENQSRVVLAISPFLPGNNNFTVSFLDKDRNPIDMSSAQLRYTQVDKGIGPITVNAQRVSTGVFSAKAAFGIGGHWTMRVEGVPAAANALSIVGSYDLYVKPDPKSLTINIQEYRMPDNSSLPLYPVYDAGRNAIWVGDTALGSGQLWKFDVATGNFTSFKIPGINLATILAMDSQNRVWFIDPLTRSLGVYDPANDKSQLYAVNDNGTLSGLAADDSRHSVWVVASTTNHILQFDTQSQKFVRSVGLPAPGSNPFSIISDKSTGLLWVADEALGKIARIDPSKNYNVTEFAPNGGPLSVPTAMIMDPDTGILYISEHEGHAVDAFNPLLHSFTRYPLDQDPQSLPFGMAFDSNHLLWVAQHTLNKILVLDPRTGVFNEQDIPLGATQTQWIVADSEGRVWLSEQRAAAFGMVTSTANPAYSPSTATNQTAAAGQNGILHLGIGYTQLAGPAMIAGLVAVAALYAKSVMTLGQSVRQARDMDPTAGSKSRMA
ncbi:MAG: copper resistance protein CopC [Nitrososphaera sp.]